jgi:hypothetical protein
MKLGGILTLATALILTGCEYAPLPVSDKVAEHYETHTNPPTPKPPVVVPVESGRLNPGNKVVFFGDSWTSAASSYAHQVGAAFGLETEVVGANGPTGYLNGGRMNTSTYAQRLAEMPVSDAEVLVLQSSVYDFTQVAANLGPAFDKTLRVAREKFPSAQFIIIGPSTNQWPEPPALYTVNDILHERTLHIGMTYVSPYEDRWVDASNFERVIDPDTTQPTEAGHAYLAAKLVETLKAIQIG